MVNEGNVFLVLGIVLVLGLALPVALFFSSRRGQGAEQIELYKRAASRARNPRKAEDDKLEELSSKVRALKDEEEED
jgi:hypothetical protein